MNAERFIDKINYGNAIVKRLKIYCEEQNLNLEYILYEYYPYFKKCNTQEETRKILNDIKNYDPLKNLTVKQQYITLMEKITRDITPEEVEEGEIMCPKCKGKKVFRSQAQTRSGDEGFTQYFRCVNPHKSCKFKWKKGG